MEEVISKLSEIEITARHIMDEAELKKQALSDELQQKIKDYDLSTEKEASEKISVIRSNLEAEKEQQIQLLEQKTEQTFARLEQYYRENHTRLAREIYQRIISD